MCDDAKRPAGGRVLAMETGINQAETFAFSSDRSE